MESCNERFLSGIAHIELVLANVCTMPIPFGVDELVEMDNCVVGTPSMVFDVSSGAIQMSTPSLKTTPNTDVAGYLREHDLQIPIESGYMEARAAKGGLNGKDFYAVLRTFEGTEYLLYSLPCSSVLSIDDQVGAEPKQTAKVRIISLSNMIKITRKANE